MHDVFPHNSQDKEHILNEQKLLFDQHNVTPKAEHAFLKCLQNFCKVRDRGEKNKKVLDAFESGIILPCNRPRSKK